MQEIFKMRKRLFATQEVGSLQRPYWLQEFGEQLDRMILDAAVEWGNRLGVDEANELVNNSGDGLLQKSARLVTVADKERVKEIASIYAIRMQENAGLDRIFNGEQMRTEMYSFMANFINGITRAGVLNSFDANYFIKGVINGRIAILRNGIDFFIKEFDFTKGHTNREVKTCLTGPYTMVDWSYLEHYTYGYEASNVSRGLAIRKGREEAVMDFATEVLNPVVHALENSGAKFIQIDEPAAASDEGESGFFVKALNASFKDISKEVMRAVHLCYSDYSKLFPDLAECKANSYLIEFTNHSSPDKFRESDVDQNTFRALSLFKEYGMKAKIGIGVVDIHSDMLESPEKIRDEIMVASKILGDPSLVEVNPDCGLRTRNPEVAYAKLGNMVRGAELARTEYGE
jgi:5-methyltetrahydropteroyltriglutamate--homocysteine methyltransferase